MVKFLVDVGVGKKVEIFLKEAGYDVLPIREVNTRAQDIEILRLAVEEKRLIVTMDKDFGELVFNSGQPHAGVLILRLENATGEQKQKSLKKLLVNFQIKLPIISVSTKTEGSGSKNNLSFA